jgi:hypothetical protein
MPQTRTTNRQRKAGDDALAPAGGVDKISR